MSITDMNVRSIMGGCVRKQAFNLCFDWWVGNFPVCTGTVDGWNGWENSYMQEPASFQLIEKRQEKVIKSLTEIIFLPVTVKFV